MSKLLFYLLGIWLLWRLVKPVFSPHSRRGRGRVRRPPQPPEEDLSHLTSQDIDDADFEELDEERRGDD